MKYSDIREESLKIKVWEDYFKGFDTTEIPWNIDFCVMQTQQDLFWTTAPLLWAEAKTWDYDICAMITQLILTIWKAKTYNKTLPPVFLWWFDFKKIAFIEYLSINDIFYMNDFNRNVTPSNHDTKEFNLVYRRVEELIQQNAMVFDYEEDDDKLRYFISTTFAQARNMAKVRVDKNNFLSIYLRRLQFVKPNIWVDNWDELKKNNILDSDFFLADLFVDDRNTIAIADDETVKNDLFVVFDNWWYKISKESMKTFFDQIIPIKNPRQYELFRKNYKRPPIRQYHEYIIQRRDLLVPKDIRERKWAFFTPRIWVEKSQEYMAEYFWENYQDEYYIWDCCAGTGNLLAWLTNKYNIYATTLDMADVNVMHEMIKNNAINLLESHVSQFDFLNDNFDKLPEWLKEIINDSEKRKKLIVYINPPYAETAVNKTSEEWRINKRWVSFTNIQRKYSEEIGIATKELFAQFLYRIYKEIPNCKIANFSTLKNLQWANFSEFRKGFLAKLEKIFVVPWNTFDNVKWQFPIWFFIRNSVKKEKFDSITADVYDRTWNFEWLKTIKVPTENRFLTDWYKQYHTRVVSKDIIGAIWLYWSDFQHNNFIRITNFDEHPNRYTFICKENLIQTCIYLSVRHCIEATWLNDRDQYLRPLDSVNDDIEFQNDCLIYTLFHWQNRITSSWNCINHRIPFTEIEVNAKEKFSSHFMIDFLKGREFSPEAKDVISAWKKLWIYYHEKANSSQYSPNASLYEIREYFQWRNDNGKMNNKSDDEKYNELIWNLREKSKILWDKIAEKVYEYEFLKR